MHSFGNGEKVEVKTYQVWFPARVIRTAPASRRPGKVYVSYETLFEENCSEDGVVERGSELRAFADLADVRPEQPGERHRYFKVGDEVEILTGVEERGWIKGRVTDILEDSKYEVAVAGIGVGGVGGGTKEVAHWDLRLFRVWDDGYWIPPFPLEKLPISLKTKCSPFHNLVEGMGVEVMRKYEGAKEEVWYPATIMGATRDERFLVMVGYKTLRTEEGSQIVEEVDVRNIRPSPPFVFLGMPAGFEQVDGWYRGGWWVGHVSQVIAGAKYVVSMKNTAEEMVFDHSKLRQHLDLDMEGKWNPAPQISLKTSSRPKLKINGLEETFTEGMMVEVRTDDEEAFIGSLLPAKIVSCIGNGEYIVQYQTLKKASDETQPLVEVIAGSRLRPCPPEIEKDGYEMLEEVDAWEHDGWWSGLISRFSGPSEYGVYFWTTNQEYRYARDHLRPHQDWTCGKWTAPPTPKKSSSEVPFSVGMVAELKTNAYGFVGAYFSAKVVSCLHKDKYIVEYETLWKDDGSGLLLETVDGYQIRPPPPPVVKIGCYTLLELVDAWYNEGWWVGLISRVLDSSTTTYNVYFWTSNDEMELPHCDLRPHQEWTHGNWTTPLKMSNSLLKSKLGKFVRRERQTALGACFLDGKTVEICSMETGFHDAWFPAVIIRPMGAGKYLVRYLTVTEDNETQPLIQEAHGSCIRPSPPVFLQEEPFKDWEQVDAWHCQGWFAGQIQKVAAGSKYSVHLNTTGEVAEFQYEYLRPHQDWCNPEWKSYTKGRALPEEC